MEMAAITHLGNVRDNNEDAYYLDTEKGKLFAIADGMGGHNAGEVASKMAIEKMLAVFNNQPVDRVNIISIIRDVFEQASVEIDEMAKTDEHYDGMGTTLTLVFVDKDVLYIGHIGDSRAYMINSSGIKTMTRDHTLVSELVKNGTITEKEARKHPQKNVIMKAIGSGCKAIPDIHEVEIDEESVFIICSDGLTDLVDDLEIQETIKNSETLAMGLMVLKDLALERGGFDNVTIVAACIKTA